LTDGARRPDHHGYDDRAGAPPARRVPDGPAPDDGRDGYPAGAGGYPPPGGYDDLDGRAPHGAAGSGRHPSDAGYGGGASAYARPGGYERAEAGRVRYDERPYDRAGRGHAVGPEANADTGEFQATGGYGDTGSYQIDPTATAPPPSADRSEDRSERSAGYGERGYDQRSGRPRPSAPDARPAARDTRDEEDGEYRPRRGAGARDAGPGAPGLPPPPPRGRPAAARRRPDDGPSRDWDDERPGPGRAGQPGRSDRPGQRRRPADGEGGPGGAGPGAPGRRRRPGDDGYDGSGPSRRRVRPAAAVDDDDDDGDDDGPVSLSRRLVTAVLVLAAAFVVGIGAAVLWQKVSPSEASSDQTAKPAPATAGPTGLPSPTAAATASPRAAVPVPADWVPYSAAALRASFSHPPGWSQREDDTGVFFHEPSPAGPGLKMIGVARVEGKAADAALNQVQQTEFGSAGLADLTPGSPSPVAGGAGAFELTGSYDRQGQKVTYTLRSLSAGGAVYVLCARTASTAQQDRAVLLGALESSFRPA
jgi:hypothetical protein